MKLSTEERLLVQCAAACDSSEDASAYIPDNSHSYSHSRVMQLAHWHRMPGKLFAFLRDTGSNSLLPESEIEHLLDHYRHSAVRNMVIRSEFGKIVNAFQAEGIEVMALKGVALLGNVYKDPGTRFMSDIDLLVRDEDAERAQQIVASMPGYEVVGEVPTAHRHLPRIGNAHLNLAVEIHHHIVWAGSPLHFDISTFWERARKKQLHGVEVLVPCVEHMLMHLCLHFFLDRRYSSYSSLRQLGDVTQVTGMYKEDVNWDFFLEEVQRLGLVGPVFSVLSIVSTLMDAEVPERILSSLRPKGYSEKMEELFIRQRVIQTSAITATDLVPHEAGYTAGALLKTVVRRISPSKRYMVKRYGEEAVDNLPRTRVKRFGELMQRIFAYVRNPFRLWQEVKVDRWLHSLSSVGVVGDDTKDEKQSA